jgi:hypothetical protein
MQGADTTWSERKTFEPQWREQAARAQTTVLAAYVRSLAAASHVARARKIKNPYLFWSFAAKSPHTVRQTTSGHSSEGLMGKALSWLRASGTAGNGLECKS